MNHTKPQITSDIDNEKIELVENKLISWLNNFWQFSLFYGNYLAGLHSQKKNYSRTKLD